MSACQNCKGTLTLECGEFVFAPCVIVQSDLTDISEFFEEDCVTLHDLIPEIYELLTELSLNDYDKNCLDLPDEPTHLEIEQAQTDEICAIKETLEGLNCLQTFLDLEINPSGDGCESSLDTSCLQPDPCLPGEQIITFGDLIQTLINKVCELESHTH